jgi:membrane protease YdiL (CAAX protease family)
MPAKLTSSDYKVIVVGIVVSALSLSIGVKYFSHAFPEAAIRFRVNRNDSAPLAEKFLAARGVKLNGYRHAAEFDYDDQAKVYLERTQGLERMNRLTSGPVHLWHWSHRWFKPQQKEEFRVDVTPVGDVVGFDHDLPEAAPGADLDQASARTVAETFLSQVMGRNLNDLEFIETQKEKRPARTDHDFTWKQKSVDLGDGSLRIEVEVDGAAVAGYREFVKVPEQWTRDYDKLRSRNNTAETVDTVFWILLSVAMLVILIRRLRDRDVPVWMSVAFGGVGTGLFLLGQLNTFSLAEFGYTTTDSYSSFVTNYFWESLLGSVGIGAFIFLLVAASEPVYREGFPNQLSLRRYFSWQGFRSRSFFIANVVGISLTFFFFAYQTLFYLAAGKLGAWAPADIPFSDLLNTRVPWVTVLFIGFLPAVSEEMQFRAFSIPFLRKWLRSAPVAVVLSAFIWGFLHANYPNQPFYIRGLEVGLGGIVTGMVMLRFGILATLIWHYSVDALYTAFLLLRSPNHYLMASGAVSAGIMLIPLIVALAAYLSTGTFSDEESLTNAREGVSRPVHEKVLEPGTSLVYVPLSRKRLIWAGALTLFFILLATIPVFRFGEGLSLHTTRPQAVSSADAWLRQHQVDPGSYRRVAWIHENVDSLAVRYLLEHKTIKETDQTYRLATRLALWQVRYFRPLEKAEHRVFVDPATGQVFGYRALLDEDTPGVSLSSVEAQELAAKYVESQGYHLSDFDLQNSEAEKRKAREDYTLVWQAKAADPRNVGDAHYRLEVDVAGNQVIGFVRSFKLPEAWERARSSSSLVNSLLGYAGISVGLVLIGVALFLLVKQIRSGQIPWRPAAMVGAVVMVVMALSEINQLPGADRQYATSEPLSAWHLTVAVSLFVVPLLSGLACWLLAGLAASFYPWVWHLFRRASRLVWRRDAAVCIILGLAAEAGLSNLGALFASRFHAVAPVSIGLFPDMFNAAWPGAGFFLRAVGLSVFYATGIALLIFIVRLGWSRRAWWLGVGILLVLISLGPASAHSAREFFAGWVVSFAPWAVAVAIAVWFFRDNVLAYFGAVFCAQVAGPMFSMFEQHAAFWRMNGLLLAALAALFLAWLFVAGLGTNARNEQ